MSTARAFAVAIPCLVSALLASCSSRVVGGGTSEPATRRISGTVSGTFVGGVTVTLGGAAASTTVTGASGAYAFDGLADGRYTLTPSKPGYTYTPSSVVVTVNGADVTGRDFVTGGCTTDAECDDGNGCTRDLCDATLGCGHILEYGPSCSTPRPAADVTIRSFVLAGTGADGADLHANQRVTVSVSLEAEADHPGYPLAFHLVPAPIPGDGSQVHSLAMGQAMLPMVSAGTGEYSAELTIPAGVTPGDYELLAQVYPDGALVRGGAPAPIYHLVADPGLPVLHIADFDPYQRAFLVDPAGVVDPAALTSEVNTPYQASIGIVARDHAAARLALTASLRWPDADSAPIPLQIWDTSAQRYTASLDVRNLAANAPRSIALMLALAKADADALQPRLTAGTPYTASLTVEVNADGALAEGPCAAPSAPSSSCRHVVEMPAMLILPPPPDAASVASAAAASGAGGVSLAFEAPVSRTTTTSGPQSYSGYASRFAGNKYAGVGMTFSNSTSMTSAGYATAVTAVAPMSLFAHGFDFGRVEVTGSAPLSGSSQVRCTVKMLGFTLHDENPVGANVALASLFPAQVKEIAYQDTIYIEGVPVTLTLGARGSFATGGSIGARSPAAIADQAALSAGILPSAGVDAFGAAELGWPGFGVGVEVDLQLIQANLSSTTGGSLAIVRQSGNVAAVGSLTDQMSYALSYLAGSIDAFVEWWTPEWCCGCWGVCCVPCGASYSKASLELCSWSGTQLGNVVVSSSDPSRAIALSTCTPSYSCFGKCGSVPDGCGGQASCGSCAWGTGTCGGGGVPNVCGCAPVDCTGRCGTLYDGCGHAKDCGGCTYPQTCGGGGGYWYERANYCGCVDPALPGAYCPGLDCGVVKDKCGRDVSCGTCTLPSTCGGAGVANRCGCTPSYSCAGKCGYISNGCYGFVDCGSCSAPETCGGGGVQNVCGCTPARCNGRCGVISDGCGGQLDCPGCTAPNTCGGGGSPNICGCTPHYDCTGKCGYIPNGCGADVSCGDCPGLQWCGGGGVPNVCGCTPQYDCTGRCGLIPDGCGGQVDCGGAPSYDCTGKCGLIPDGCGGSGDCGGCPAPQTCGGSGIPNVCGVATCGNELIEPGEQCDGTNLAGKTCRDLTGMDGTLACTNCMLDTSGCTTPIACTGCLDCPSRFANSCVNGFCARQTTTSCESVGCCIPLVCNPSRGFICTVGGN